MMLFTRKITGIAFKNALKKYHFEPRFLFCANKTLSPIYQRIKEVFTNKGKNSKEYQQEMVKAIRDALGKYDYPQAVNIELFHLSLIKEAQGQTSEGYRDQIREIIKFSINRLQFDVAAKLVQELRDIQAKVSDISPLDIVATLFVQGHVYSQLGRLDESKKCLNQCLQMKHVKQGPQVYFKVFAQLAKVHIKAGQLKEAYEKLNECEQFIATRQIDPKSPPMIQAMDLQDVYSLAEIASSLKDKQLALKYMQMYRQKLQKFSNMKDPFYTEYLERISKIHFNLQQFEKSIEYLEKAAVLSEELGKTNKSFIQNAKVMRNIQESIVKNYIKK